MGRPPKIALSELEIRQLNKKDIPEILAIEKLSFPSPWSGQLFSNELEHDFSHFQVMLSNQKVIGYAGFWLIADEAHITNLAIAPNFRRLGLALKLLKSLLQEACENGASCATLEVRESNRAALDLYKKLDFQAVAIRKKYYADTQEDAIIMWLNPLTSEC